VKRRRLWLTAALLAGWAVYGVVWTAISLRRPGVPPLVALRYNLWVLVPTMLTTLVVPVLASRLRIIPGQVRAAVAIHVALACAFGIAQSALYWKLGIFRAPIPVFGLMAFRYVVRDALAYLLVVAIVHARDYWQLWHDEQVRAARTRSEIARAAVDALCWRVQPGVILPALDRVDLALGRDPDEAEEALARLGELLRLLLKDPERGLVSVADDVGVVEAAAATLHGGVAVSASGADGARTAALPRLFLLALLHGTLAREGSGIRLDARREGDSVCLSVAADPSLDAESVDAARQRLEAAWPERVGVLHSPGGVRFRFPAAAA
jgi:hypothetical protein